jgi:hypothetical protein
MDVGRHPGTGGLIDLNLVGLVNYGVVAGVVEGLLAQDARSQIEMGPLAGELAALSARVTAAEMLALSRISQASDPSQSVVSAVLTASEVLVANAPVNVWSNAGAYNVRNADTTSAIASPKDCHGFVRTAAGIGNAVRVYFSGPVTTAALTPGPVWLGAAGAVSSTPNATVGQIVQQVGVAISATTWIFQPEPAVGT